MKLIRTEQFLIKTESISEDSAEVHVERCKTKATVSTASNYYEITPGQSYAVDFKIKYPEDSACPAMTYNLTSAMNGLEGSLSQESVTLNPNQKKTVTLTVQIPEEEKRYTFSLTAKALGTPYTYSKNVKVLANSSEDHFKPKIHLGYYKNNTGGWISLPNFGSLTPKEESLRDEIGVLEYKNNDSFALKFEGYIKLEPGVYTLALILMTGAKLILTTRPLSIEMDLKKIKVLLLKKERLLKQGTTLLRFNTLTTEVLLS